MPESQSTESSSPILSYTDLIVRERQNLQKGMNFRAKGDRPSVFLMSVRPNAPYRDIWSEEEQLLIYEGHDATANGGDRKVVDQPMYRDSGRLSDNGKFFEAAMGFKKSETSLPHRVQVYEKLDRGVWFDKGIFDLRDAAYEHDGTRKVFKFFLRPSSVANSFPVLEDYEHERMIPTHVKVEVWKRDKGVCRECGAKTGLHYDHILPYSRGGRSDDSRNIQLLCARHNLSKGARIQ